MEFEDLFKEAQGRDKGDHPSIPSEGVLYYRSGASGDYRGGDSQKTSN